MFVPLPAVEVGAVEQADDFRLALARRDFRHLGFLLVLAAGGQRVVPAEQQGGEAHTEKRHEGGSAVHTMSLPVDPWGSLRRCRRITRIASSSNEKNE